MVVALIYLGVGIALVALVASAYQMRKLILALNLGRVGLTLFRTHWTLKLWVGTLLAYVAAAFAVGSFPLRVRQWIWLVLVYLLVAQCVWCTITFRKWRLG